MAFDISIVVPTLNEAENFPALFSRIAAAMSGCDYEVLVVDDGSCDGTPAVCIELARTHPITLHVRPHPVGGLSGAVLYGFARAEGELLVVMDADLQHPPEALPAIIAPLRDGSADLVIGSRRCVGGQIDGRWGIGRRLNSLAARLVALPFAGSISDPMSGFFAIRRTTWLQAPGLNPIGYKIALELICKCRNARLAEVPIHFGRRTGGKSKMTWRQQLNYVRHVTRLYRTGVRARMKPRHPSLTPHKDQTGSPNSEALDAYQHAHC